MVVTGMRRLVLAALLLTLLLAQAAPARGPRPVSFALRGVKQTLHLYDPQPSKAEPPVVLVASGDGGWHTFITEIAEYLARQGYPVVGLDAKDYLETLSKPKALEPGQVTGDFATVIRFAESQSNAKSAVLLGWSEGAGLAVLGGLDPSVRPTLLGVVAIGLPELNELAWRWSDSVIYVTHKVPNEPTFNCKDYVGKLAPLPLAMIQSTHDDFVPVATAREIFARAQQPKQFALIDARSHRFDGQREAFWQALDRALAWFESAPKVSP
jgi:dienelactone hydrolase